MNATSQGVWHTRLILITLLAVAATSCVLAYMWLKSPAAFAQDAEESANDANFVVNCNYSHRKQVDPIVTPNGVAMHQHDFFANRTTDANSDLSSLQRGSTTCSRPADLSAYWVPTLYWKDNSGTITRRTSNKALFYYRLAGKSVNVDVKPHPAGLKVVTAENSNVNWRCANGTWSRLAPTQCTNGKLVVRIRFPDCSNGNLDSADSSHRTHMAYSVLQSNGIRTCPSTHPVPVPQLQMNIQYPIPTTAGQVLLDRGCKTSPCQYSDDPRLIGSQRNLASYTTMHADFFNAWTGDRLNQLVAKCINAAPFSSSNPKPAECLIAGT